MGSDEGAIARDLETMLDRFRGDARAALGLGPDGDAAVARARFMDLAKRYHPAKYARLSPPVVRLANETFLAIRRAYDSVVAEAARPAPAPRVPARMATGPTPLVAAPRPAPAAPAAPRPAVVTPRPAPAAPAAPRPAPAATPTATGAPRPAPAAPRAPSTTPRRDPPPPRDERFDHAIELLRARRWLEARPLLSALAAEAPADVRYRAYLHYLRGWEAHELGKDAEARAEWRRALACDPGLGMAQWALEKTGVA